MVGAFMAAERFAAPIIAQRPSSRRRDDCTGRCGMTQFVRVSLLAVCILGAASMARANLILNGGFESGTWAGWTATLAPSGSILFIGSRGHSERDAAWFGAIGRVDDQLSQTFPTVAGEPYVVEFWLAHGGASPGNDFSVWWNDRPILALVNAGRFGYTNYTFLELATGSTAQIRFSGRDLQSYYYLDDVAITANPEPTSLVLMGTGTAVLVYSRRRASQHPLARGFH